MVEASRDVIVVDASIAFKWLVVEEDSDRATAILKAWEAANSRLAAPHFMLAEVSNALHRRVMRGEMSEEAAEDGIADLLSVDVAIELHAARNLYRRAIQLASGLRQSAVYDCIYLALAEGLRGELWTADERFYRAASLQFSNVRWLGEANVPS